MNLKKLATPFLPIDIEWRIQQKGYTQTKDQHWALVLAYVTNRAVMERLDDVCGPENWRNEFAPAPDGGVMCGISIKLQRTKEANPTGIITEDEWVTKWDGAENTNVEAVKGGLSGAMKRAAVQWGIGRYLYSLEQNFVVLHKEKRSADGQTDYPNRLWDKETKTTLWWADPILPKWALPEIKESDDE